MSSTKRAFCKSSPRVPTCAAKLTSRRTSYSFRHYVLSKKILPGPTFVINIIIIDFIPRLMTFCYLAAFNWWLLLCPWPLSHDWQMGSVPLVTSGWDPRNFLTGAAMIALLALVTRCILDLEVNIEIHIHGVLLLCLNTIIRKKQKCH